MKRTHILTPSHHDVEASYNTIFELKEVESGHWLPIQSAGHKEMLQARKNRASLFVHWSQGVLLKPSKAVAALQQATELKTRSHLLT